MRYRVRRRAKPRRRRAPVASSLIEESRMSVRFHIVLAGASLIALAGCAQSARQVALSQRLHTQIQAQEVTAELKIDTVASGEKLGSKERQAVEYFASAYQSEGHGALIISRPSNGPDDVAAI